MGCSGDCAVVTRCQEALHPAEDKERAEAWSLYKKIVWIKNKSMLLTFCRISITIRPSGKGGAAMEPCLLYTSRCV